MLFEIASTLVMGSIAGYSYLKTNGPATNDYEKIKRIFESNNWSGSKNETIRIHRKRKIKGGAEYVLQLPLGFDRKKIEAGKHILEDGLNVRQRAEFDPRELLKIKWDKTALKQIKAILRDKKITRKEIDLEFDGMLKIKVYNEPLSTSIPWDDGFIKYNGWCIPVGQTRSNFIYHDFKESAHMIVAGGTGFGKSQFLKMLITSLIMMQPEYVHFSLIDLKGGTSFERYKDLKQVTHYGRNPKEAKEVLTEVQEDMNKLLEHIVSKGYEDADEAGIKNHWFIIVDEAADMANDSVCMDIVADIARRGRGAHYHLIYCTQYPTNETIPSQVRPNIGSRVCFKLKTKIQSLAVLDEVGAEDLPMIKGRAIYQFNENVIIQAPYIKNDEIQTRIFPYIRIQPRKEEQHEQKSSEATEDRKHTLVFEEVGLSNQGSDTKNAQSKRRTKRKQNIK